MLADTPPTFLLFLAWALLACAAPFLAIASVVLATRPQTRRVGILILIGGIAGAFCGAIGDALLGFAVGERLSDTTAGGWIFATFGGFSLFSITAALLEYARRKIR